MKWIVGVLFLAFTLRASRTTWAMQRDGAWYIFIWLIATFLAGLARFTATRVSLAWYHSGSLRTIPANVIVAWTVIAIAALITAVKLHIGART
jgi:hypothetical protein